MGYKAAVQVLQKAEDLKAKVLRKSDLLNDSEAWTDQQQLQTIYHQVLVLDLEYALDKKVEQELWTLGFKNQISTLQELARDKKNPKRSECQALLSWCLESASGFYLTLLQELCTTFELNFPFRKPGSVYGIVKGAVADQISFPQSSSCLYICQYCLVHLGDIARYRNQRQQAESFYKQAIMVSPTSGHPYNQLALLEASQGDKFSTVFYYVRGIAVKNPFPVSTTNLLNTLNATMDKESPITKVQTKMTLNEFLQLFLCLHGFLQTATELDQAEIVVKSINSTLTALVATQSFTSDKLMKMTVINLYALMKVSENETEKLTGDERPVRRMILDLLAGSLSAFLMPVHTFKTDESLLSYYALPSIKLLAYWLTNKPQVLQEDVFSSRLQIWPSLCKLLNNIQRYLKNDVDFDKYKTTPLPEDRDLQGFLPLGDNFKEFDFNGKEAEEGDVERSLRGRRLLDFAEWLTGFDVNASKLIIKRENEGVATYEPACIQPDPTEDLLEEIKSLSIVESAEILSKSRGLEKRGGILKPQGSLEKSREERVNGSQSANAVITKAEPTKLKRAKQNVALQSIFKKMEENKQVKFNVEMNEPDKEEKKPVKFETTPPPPPPLSTKQVAAATSHLNQSYRTQAFNQNHPALSVMQNDDYMRNTFTSQSKIVLDKLPGMAFGAKGGDYSGIMQAPPPAISQYSHPSSQQMFNQSSPMSYSQPSSQSGYGMPLSSLNQQQQQQQYQPYQSWKNEDSASAAISSWWLPPSSAAPTLTKPYQQQQQQQQQDSYYQYSNSLQSYLSRTTSGADFMGKAQAGGHVDLFGSPWGSSRGYEQGPGQGMSMRQAMLKETGNLPGLGVGHGNALPGSGSEKFMQMPANAPGYSLFNTSSWAPNLPGQLRSSSDSARQQQQQQQQHQQSLFSQGPKSLAQLVEQQNQQKSNP